jgi:hypothetical protein
MLDYIPARPAHRHHRQRPKRQALAQVTKQGFDSCSIELRADLPIVERPC